VRPAAVRKVTRGLLARFLSSSKDDIDVILLGAGPGFEERTIRWVPDFQEERFPQFFPAEEVEARRKRNAGWFRDHRHIMFSSEDVHQDYRRYYDGHSNVVHVENFATFIDCETVAREPAAVRAKYPIPERYFICNNQLWLHKNHSVVLRALAELAGDPSIPPVVFTGQQRDYRDQSYGPRIKAMAKELGLSGRALFLGFLPREDQLSLMSQAIAVVQPSLCEGWSTVVEDAKALGKQVLASNLAVHRDQLRANADFFDPEDSAALARLLRTYSARDPSPVPLDYGAAQRKFASEVAEMLGKAEADFRRRGVVRYVLER
jgi:glycosyltransferase involved in cell wall biosynthesis